MKVYVPDYYKEFQCIADRCKHTCCKSWEVEIDEESRKKYRAYPNIEKHIEASDNSDEMSYFRLSEDETCPFLLENGLCEMILQYGEDMLCQTCTDHPRFRNFWSDRIEMGLGLVCEEAARIILGREKPMTLELYDMGPGKFFRKEADRDGEPEEDEKWLLEKRNTLIRQITEEGPIARLKEYLLYRHIADALYDDRLEERIAFVNVLCSRIQEEWEQTDKSPEALVEIARNYSYDVEYDEEVKERYLDSVPLDDIN